MEPQDVACARLVSLSPVLEDRSSLNVVMDTCEMRGDVLDDHGRHDEEFIDEITKVAGDPMLHDLGIEPKGNIVDNVIELVDDIFNMSLVRDFARETVRTESEGVDRSNPDTFSCLVSDARIMQLGSAVGQGPTASLTRSCFAIDDGLNQVGPNGHVSR